MTSAKQPRHRHKYGRWISVPLTFGPFGVKTVEARRRCDICHRIQNKEGKLLT